MAFGRVEKVAGFKVSAKKMGPRERTAVSGLISNGRLRKSDTCTIVIFHGRGGRVTAAQRCDNRKLSTAAKARVRREGLPPGFKHRKKGRR